MAYLRKLATRNGAVERRAVREERWAQAVSAAAEDKTYRDSRRRDTGRSKRRVKQRDNNVRSNVRVQRDAPMSRDVYVRAAEKSRDRRGKSPSPVKRKGRVEVAAAVAAAAAPAPPVAAVEPVAEVKEQPAASKVDTSVAAEVKTPAALVPALARARLLPQSVAGVIARRKADKLKRANADVVAAPKGAAPLADRPQRPKRPLPAAIAELIDERKLLRAVEALRERIWDIEDTKVPEPAEQQQPPPAMAAVHEGVIIHRRRRDRRVRHMEFDSTLGFPGEGHLPEVKMPCNICGEFGHFVKACPKHPKAAAKDSFDSTMGYPGEGPSSTIICHKCGIAGHMGKACKVKVTRLSQLSGQSADDALQGLPAALPPRDMQALKRGSWVPLPNQQAAPIQSAAAAAAADAAAVAAAVAAVEATKTPEEKAAEKKAADEKAEADKRLADEKKQAEDIAKAEQTVRSIRADCRDKATTMLLRKDARSSRDKDTIIGSMSSIVRNNALHTALLKLQERKDGDAPPTTGTIILEEYNSALRDTINARTTAATQAAVAAARQVAWSDFVHPISAVSRDGCSVIDSTARETPLAALDILDKMEPLGFVNYERDVWWSLLCFVSAALTVLSCVGWPAAAELVKRGVKHNSRELLGLRHSMCAVSGAFGRLGDRILTLASWPVAATIAAFRPVGHTALWLVGHDRGAIEGLYDWLVGFVPPSAALEADALVWFSTCSVFATAASTFCLLAGPALVAAFEVGCARWRTQDYITFFLRVMEHTLLSLMPWQLAAIIKAILSLTSWGVATFGDGSVAPRA